MRSSCTPISKIIVFALVVSGFLMPPLSMAEDAWSRGGKWEIFGFGRYLAGDETSSSGIELEFDGIQTLGIGVGYSFNDYLNLNGDIWFGSSETKVTPPRYSFAQEISFDTDFSALDINLDYNILKSRITPVLSAGIGVVTVDGDIAGERFDESNFSWNVGAGLRWDIIDHMLLKITYRLVSTKIEDTTDPLILRGAELSLGYIF